MRATGGFEQRNQAGIPWTYWLLLHFKLICINSHPVIPDVSVGKWFFSKAIHFCFEFKSLLSQQGPPCINYHHFLYTFSPYLYKIWVGSQNHPDLLNVILNPRSRFLIDYLLFSFYHLHVWKTFFSSLIGEIIHLLSALYEHMYLLGNVLKTTEMGHMGKWAWGKVKHHPLKLL